MKAPARVDLDFQSHTGGGWAGIALLAVGVIAAAGSVQWYRHVDGEAARLEAKAGELRRMVRRSSGQIVESSRDSKELQQEIRAANRIIQQLSVPWDALFRELEASTGKTVILLAVQPDLANRQVRISGEGKDLEAVYAYTQRLDETDLLDRVYLTEHAVKTQDPQKPVAFSLVAEWTEPR
jgi:hypothetical protein